MVANLNEVHLYDIRNEGKLSSQFSFEDLEGRLMSVFGMKSYNFMAIKLFDILMEELERAFLNCNIYVGLLQPKGELIIFSLSSSLSE